MDAIWTTLYNEACKVLKNPNAETFGFWCGKQDLNLHES